MSGNDIADAAELLRMGQLVAFPTETVYGLGGNACSDAAAARIYAVKGRPSFNPLIVHVASIGEAEGLAVVNDKAARLMRRFWPGPLTLVLPKRADCKLSLLVSAGLDSVALRLPAHPMAQALLQAAGLPIAAPSANLSGRVSPTEAAHVRHAFSEAEVPLVLDGGGCAIGIESTVVDLTGETPVLLRPGAVTIEQLRNAIGAVRLAGEGDATGKSPGMLKSHYAPLLKLRLNATTVQPDEALLAFGPEVPKGSWAMENLSATGNLEEAAANLFAMLRRLDASGARAIAAMPVPENGLGMAINDRLRRAATA